jgi:hypothetical protein
VALGWNKKKEPGKEIGERMGVLVQMLFLRKEMIDIGQIMRN